MRLRRRRARNTSDVQRTKTSLYQTELTLAAMPLVDARARSNLRSTLTRRATWYLDPGSRTAMKADLVGFYSSAVARFAASARRSAAAASLHSYIAYPPDRGPLETRDASARPWSLPNLCAAYRWPKDLTGGGVIAVVELDGVEAFFGVLGQPVPNITRSCAKWPFGLKAASLLLFQFLVAMPLVGSDVARQGNVPTKGQVSH